MHLIKSTKFCAIFAGYLHLDPCAYTALSQVHQSNNEKRIGINSQGSINFLSDAWADK